MLHDINSPKDLRKLSLIQLPDLAQELREFIIDIVATKEGHLGASLGVVELTIALHYVFNTPDDLLVWDVGHQAYVHKLLTGRRDRFHTNRQLGGISGFPVREESPYDTFGVGHSSTSISAALGMAIASQLQGEGTKQHIAVIGDASIASGMAFEALNHAGVTNANLLIILNDNAIGIDPSVGALKEYFAKTTVGDTPGGTIFEALSLTYKGPVDGHNLDALVKELKRQKELKGPRILHVVTKKGKGLRQAEEDQVRYHAPGKFDKLTGDIPKVTNAHEQLPEKFQEVFGKTLVELAEANSKIIGITPAMPTGSSLTYMMERFPKRAFDVGIAEQHAVTFSAGMATQGFKVFCVIYSTFLQRAYDQVIHDVALQNLPVVFCIDRAGLVGNDGATHHGVFDLAYLNAIPNLRIAAPATLIDLRNLLYTASIDQDGPIAIRYPRGRGEVLQWKRPFKQLEIGKGKQLKAGITVAVLSLGAIAGNVTMAIQGLPQHDQEKVAHYDMRWMKPLDHELLDQIVTQFDHIITVEDSVIKGGFGEAVVCYFAKRWQGKHVEVLGIPDQFIEHGSTMELKEIAGISTGNIQKLLQDMI
ncbi:1-deoxy-D-xylulose-5-phosphate synthase [Gangjinia marincola]|uniref:1-deoxy-D-xylulose-5-phosphate synthase n=1 Tax=Gangjinia marincola TaxID=578463 RepID=A0ABN1MIC9_9FLAO